MNYKRISRFNDSLDKPNCLHLFEAKISYQLYSFFTQDNLLTGYYALHYNFFFTFYFIKIVLTIQLVLFY